MRLEIYAPTGRLIRTLLDAVELPTGRHEAVWRGRDDAGREVASGVYYYRLRTSERDVTRSLVLIR